MDSPDQVSKKMKLPLESRELSGPESAYQALFKGEQEKILGQFDPEQQQEIKYRQQVLSSLAYFIGKDFRIPVELNQPGAGWHWDFQQNKIRIDPNDLVEKPMDYLRFVISHEGGHRRVSRTDFIPTETWQQPGFSFMMNAIEDPRTNNFVAESYPKFREQMDLAYELDLDFEAKAKDKAQERLGYQPRFMQAGFEYIKQWYIEEKGEEPALSDDLPEDVRQVVQATLDSAKDSWLRYPSKQEADESEELIQRYAQVSYKINHDEVWPEFQKLVEKDLEDQGIQELMQEMMQGEEDAEREGVEGMSQGLNDSLNESEQKELEEAIRNAQEQASGQPDQEGKGTPIDLSSLSEELKQKIKDFIDSLSDGERQELEQQAGEALREFEREVNQELEGKLADNPDRQAEATGRRSKGEKPEGEEERQTKGAGNQEISPEETEEYRRFRDLIEKTLATDENVYEEVRREVLPIIDQLEADLREIFVARRSQRWQTGFKRGKKIDIKRRMQEKALGVSAVESKAWQKRELPQEKDYAISLLVDLSGSMQGQKIYETFKATIVLAEVLNRLSIQTEILGFNDRLYEYQEFGQDMSGDIRARMGGMLDEVSNTGDTGRARWNDDGWALDRTSERLARQKAKERFIFVLSDGVPEESPMHPRSQYELGSIVERVMNETDQKLVGLGIGSGTGHVERYYPNSIADINVRQMSDMLADVIREVIVNYDKF